MIEVAKFDKVSSYTGPDTEGFYTCTYSDFDIERGYIVIPRNIPEILGRVHLSRKARVGQQFTWQLL